MNRSIGYLVRDDFNNIGDLDNTLKPALVMIKSRNCKYCVMAEPEFRAAAAAVASRHINSFFSQPFDGNDEAQLQVADILSQITNTENIGLPTYILYRTAGPRLVKTGMMNRGQLESFINAAILPAPVSVDITPTPSFVAYNR